MKKKMIAISTAMLMTFSIPIPLTSNVVFAETDVSSVKEKREKVKLELTDAENKIADILVEINEIQEEIDLNNKALTENQKYMGVTETEIADTETEINKLEKEIKKLEEAIEKRYDILVERAQSYQRAGGDINYIEVIFGSSSFGDFINRVTAVNKITESDTTLLEQQESDKQKVANKQDDLVNKLDDLKQKKAELEEMISLIEDQKLQSKAKKSELEEKKDELVSMKNKLQIEDSRLAEIESSLKVPATNVQVASSSSSSSSSDHSTKVTGSGQFVWPAVGGYISSYVGPRWGRMHNGIDIARPSKRDILAADNGVVEAAGYAGGLGNRIIINHGNGLKTVYGHMSSLKVSAGQNVHRGQRIGIMGSTGNSTGVHLHFEVHQNGAVQNPLDYLR